MGFDRFQTGKTAKNGHQQWWFPKKLHEEMVTLRSWIGFRINMVTWEPKTVFWPGNNSMAYWLTVGFNTTKIMVEAVFPPGLKSAATTDETEGSSFMEHHWPTKPALMMVYLWRSMPTQLDKCHTLAKHHHVLNVSLGLKWPSFRVKQQIRDFRQGLSFIDILLANPLYLMVKTSFSIVDFPSNQSIFSLFFPL